MHARVHLTQCSRFAWRRAVPGVVPLGMRWRVAEIDQASESGDGRRWSDDDALTTSEIVPEAPEAVLLHGARRHGHLMGLRVPVVVRSAMCWVWVLDLGLWAVLVRMNLAVQRRFGASRGGGRGPHTKRTTLYACP